MRTSRSGTAAAVHTILRFLVITLIALRVVEAGPAAGAVQEGRAKPDVTQTLTGTVVDQSGNALPRAYVRAKDSSAREIAAVFADEAGRFRFTLPSLDCEIAASLTGFEPVTTACTAQPMRIVLAVAPIRETVVVTATGTEAPAGLVGTSVTTYTADDLTTRQTPLVADLLRASPGVMFIRAGGPGTVTSLFVRGGESNYNKVLLDGIPLNEPGGTFNFSNLTTENLERVELVRGAHSALFGSDAMASVVQLFTRRPDRADQKPHAAFSLEGGTYATLRTVASVSGVRERLDYVLAAARLDTDNRVPNNEFGNTTLSANIGVALNGSATIRFIARNEREKVGTPGQTAFGRPDLDAFFERGDTTAGIAFDQQMTPTFRQRGSYSLAASNYQSTNLLVDPPYTPRFENRVAPFEFSDFTFDSLTDLRRHHASYQADWRLPAARSHGDQLVTVLADWDGERARLENRLASTVTRASRNNSGVAVQHQASWPKLFTTAGMRIEHNDSFGTAAVPRGSVVVVARTSTGAFGETRLRAGGGLGIKEPTVLQSFSPSPSFLGNPDLEPERARGIEAGIEQRLARDRAKVELTWFANRFRNIISTRTISSNPFRSQYFNIGLTRARGAELSGVVAPTSNIRGRAGYTLLASEVLDSTSPTSAVLKAGQSLFRRPRHSGFAGVTVHEGRVTVDVNGLFVGSFVDSDFSSLVPAILTNPGYRTWDARVAIDLTRQLSGTLAIDNLTDADYMESLGYQALRRAIRAGVRVRF